MAAKKSTPKKKPTNKPKRYRSAKSGTFVSKDVAQENPDTTVRETIKPRPEPSAPEQTQRSLAVRPRDKTTSPPDQSFRSRFRLS